MTRLMLLVLVGLIAPSCGLGGCERLVRSPQYFEAHPDETSRVLVACDRGDFQGPECATAREGRAAITRDARMKFYRRSFR